MFHLHPLALPGPGAAWILWLLGALALIAFIIAVERAIVFGSSRDDFTRLRDELVALLRRGDRGEALKCLQASPSYEARIAAAGLNAQSSACAAERMAGERTAARLNMEENLAFLSALGNEAPLLGVLGSIVGIVQALRELDLAGAATCAPLATSLGEALVATAAGLLVALPSLAASAVFQRLIAARVDRADALGREVLAHFKADDLGGPQ